MSWPLDVFRHPSSSSPRRGGRAGAASPRGSGRARRASSRRSRARTSRMISRKSVMGPSHPPFCRPGISSAAAAAASPSWKTCCAIPAGPAVAAPETMPAWTLIATSAAASHAGKSPRPARVTTAPRPARRLGTTRTEAARRRAGSGRRGPADRGPATVRGASGADGDARASRGDLHRARRVRSARAETSSARGAEAAGDGSPGERAARCARARGGAARRRRLVDAERRLAWGRIGHRRAVSNSLRIKIHVRGVTKVVS